MYDKRCGYWQWAFTSSTLFSSYKYLSLEVQYIRTLPLSYLAVMGQPCPDPQREAVGG